MEMQVVEYKESWRDEFLKWIAGMANAQGGKLYIGKDDNGVTIGLNDSKKLLEDIPNKIRDMLGIVADVNLLSDENGQYIEIVIEPSSYPVSYKGEYHYRSGSTKLQLTGQALTEFISNKTGLKWDAVPVDNVKIEDLDKESFDIFKREALRNKRMTADDLNVSNEELLDRLGLLKNGRLTRAAILLFHRTPERYVMGAFVKVGFFENDADIWYQDEVTGSLMLQADRIIDLIYLKYLKAIISYDKDTRVETYPFPRLAVREAVFNAIIHKDYASGIPVQISVYEDKMYVANDWVMPADWDKSTIIEKHKSKPHNPSIAFVFYKAGYIEAWGRGIEKMCNECVAEGIARPEYTVHQYDLMLKFSARENSSVNSFVNSSANSPVKITETGKRILELIAQNATITMQEMANMLKKDVSTIRKAIKRLKANNLIERMGSDKTGYWVVKK